MKLDLGSFAFGSSIVTGGNTPSWGTSLGQQKPDLKLTYPGYDNVIIGMLYKSIPVNKVYIPLGKGGHICNSLEDDGIQLAALFDKVYINEVRVNASFIMLIYQESSDSWNGRRTLKYNPKIEYRRTENDIVYNSDFVLAVHEALQLESEACWVVSDLYIVDQDELHLIAGIVNPKHAEIYTDADSRKVAFIEAINTTYENNSHLKKYLSGDLQTIDENKSYNITLQEIYYGCPGSGKSHKVKEITNTIDPKYVFRTTFHPDTDYASFVGCYKPCSNNKSLLNGNNLTENELLQRFFDSKDEAKYKGEIKARYFYEYLINTADIRKLGLSSNVIADKLRNLQFDKTAYHEASLMSKLYDWLHDDGYVTDSAISYKFSPQVFTNAYVKAWEDTSKPVYLIIEEINRGNCAQIFGDLFQLLDRDKATGKSEYPIKADKDLLAHIESILGVNHEGIKNGELCLPPNLIIYATMNTSDQSLFPMDSAFKRRWDWEYVPIDYSKDIDSGKFTIKLDDGTEYLWVEFLEKVNDKIYDTTNSEDKQMGNFFIKKSINAKEFVNKLMFYLWNEVCKEEYGTQRNFFRKGNEGMTEFKFIELFGMDQTLIIKEFMASLEVEPIGKKVEESAAE